MTGQDKRGGAAAACFGRCKGLSDETFTAVRNHAAEFCCFYSVCSKNNLQSSVLAGLKAEGSQRVMTMFMFYYTELVHQCFRLISRHL